MLSGLEIDSVIMSIKKHQIWIPTEFILRHAQYLNHCIQLFPIIGITGSSSQDTVYLYTYPYVISYHEHSQSFSSRLSAMQGKDRGSRHTFPSPASSCEPCFHSHHLNSLETGEAKTVRTSELDTTISWVGIRLFCTLSYLCRSFCVIFPWGICTLLAVCVCVCVCINVVCVQFCD